MTRAHRPPALQHELERIAAEHRETEREATGVKRRELLRACLECLGWCATGLVLMALGFHADTRLLGEIWFWLGMVVGYAGIAWSLAAAYRRGEQRGDW